jgi:ribose transport system substrate-binding protein
MTNTRRDARRGRGRVLAVALAICAAALVAAGCGSSKSSSGSSGSGTASVSAAQAAVSKAMQPTTTYTPPGPPITNAKSLAGKTIWYVPITLEDPEFQIVSSSLQTAFGKVGVHVHACSGAANPSATSACLNQAAASGAAGVITDSIPVVEAARAFAAVQAKHIPVLVSNQLPPPPGVPGGVSGNGDDKLAYNPLDALNDQKVAADWIIADSKGSGKVLIVEFIDSPSTKAYIEQGSAAELKSKCPGCTVTIAKVQNANLSLVPSQTSSALLSHPNTNYVLTEFDAALQQVHAGVQQAGFLQKVKGASTTGVLPALQLIKAKQFLSADVGTDFPYEGWANADQMLRMLLGKPIVRQTVPARLFTSQNIGSLNLAPAGQASGEWYGNTSYQAMFAKLWGAG